MTTTPTQEQTVTQAVTKHKQSDPMAMIAAAIEHGVGPEQLERLMDLKERCDRNDAAHAFADALSKFQSTCPAIHKGRKADRYFFAGFDDIMREIKPVLADCGLSVSFSTDHNPDTGTLTVICLIKHGIHEQTSRFTCPVPKEMKVNSAQQYGAALAYAKRYAICAALNIVVTDEDTDAGNLAEPLTEAQVTHIEALIAKCGKDFNRGRFFAWIDANSPPNEVSAITQREYPRVVDSLKRKAASVVDTAIDEVPA